MATQYSNGLDHDLDPMPVDLLRLPVTLKHQHTPSLHAGLVKDSDLGAIPPDFLF